MKKAFIVVDMSNDFVDDNGGLTAGKAAQEIVKNVIKTIKEYDDKNDIIVFAMDSHSENDKHFELWPKHNVKGTWGSELYGELNVWYQDNKGKENVIFLEKSEYDAFYKTELAGILKKNDVDEVQIAGVCTDICVFNTVYGAYKEGFKTIVDKNTVATFTDNQEVFLNQMNAIYKTEIIG